MPYRTTLLSTLAAIVMATAPSQAAAQSDTDFEAALTATAPPQRPATSIGTTSGANRYVGTSHFEKAAAPRGTVPPRWRSLKAMPEQADDLGADVTEGRVDVTALLEQMVGALPLPPGALPFSCGRMPNVVGYTLGVDLSPLYVDIAARGRRGQADITDIEDRAAIDAKPLRDTLRRFFAERGFREYSRFGERAGFFDAKRGLRVEVENTSAIWRRHCLEMPKPIELPTGPIITFRFATRLGPNEGFVDEKPAPAGQRVTHPFG